MVHPVPSIFPSWCEIIAEKEKYICVDMLPQDFELVDIESPEASHSLLSTFSASIIVAHELELGLALSCVTAARRGKVGDDQGLGKLSVGFASAEGGDGSCRGGDRDSWEHLGG